jgi:hypothetical protein
MDWTIENRGLISDEEGFLSSPMRPDGSRDPVSLDYRGKCGRASSPLVQRTELEAGAKFKDVLRFSSFPSYIHSVYRVYDFSFL